MSLAYLDPGNLESNLQQGAYTHFDLVWVLWWATVIGFVLQEMSARLGLVTGRDLAQTVRDEYPAWLAILIYPVGLLAMNAVLLFLARDAIRSGAPTALSSALV